MPRTRAAVAVLALACTAFATPSAAAELIGLRVLGTRADLVSAGDALLEVTAPALRGLRVTVGGREIPVHVQGGRALALVTDLSVGSSTVEARLDAIRASSDLTCCIAGEAPMITSRP